MPRPVRSYRKVFATRATERAALERLCAAAAVTVWRGEMPPPASARFLERRPRGSTLARACQRTVLKRWWVIIDSKGASQQ